MSNYPSFWRSWQPFLYPIVLLSAATPMNASLHKAVFDDDINALEKIAKGDLNKKNAQGDTPLILAAKLGRTSIAQKLIALGAEVDAEDASGRTALFLASAAENEPIVVDLILGGADVNAQDPEGNTPLHTAAKRGLLSIARILTDNAAGIEAANSQGLRPLHLATIYGRPFLILLFALFGVSINAQDAKGNTPLHYAAQEGMSDIAEILIRLRADTNATNTSRSTPLHTAALFGSPLVALRLLEGGADIGIIDGQGRRAVEIAESQNHQAIAEAIKGGKNRPGVVRFSFLAAPPCAQLSEEFPWPIKKARTAAEAKLAKILLEAVRCTYLGVGPPTSMEVDRHGRLPVEIFADVTDSLFAAIEAQGGSVISSSSYGIVDAWVAPHALTALAAYDFVSSIMYKASVIHQLP